MRHPLSGFADLGVFYTLYLDDPDGNGVELYWDRPMEEWLKEDGSVEMYSKRLDLIDLLNEIVSLLKLKTIQYKINTKNENNF